MGEKPSYSRNQLTELYEKSSKELERAKRMYLELEAKANKSDVTDSGVLKLQDLLNGRDAIYEGASIEMKRQMVQSIVSEVRLKGHDIDIEIAFDIVKNIVFASDIA